MNLYDTLKINKNATLKEIKNAYKKLVLKYHPDINNNDGEYMKRLNLAYEILSDPKKRKNYDEINKTQEDEFNYFFNNLINKLKLTTIEDIFNSFNKIFLKKNKFICSKNYKMLYNEEEDVFLSDYEPIEINSNDIIGDIHADLSDIYKGYGKHITITRKTNINNSLIDEDKDFHISLIYDKIIIKNEGDENEEGIRSNIILKVISMNNYNYERYNTNDLIIRKDISLYEFIYGFNIYFNHLDDQLINIKINNPIYELDRYDGKLIYKLKNKGLLIESQSLLRGDLLIHCIIKVPDNAKELLYKFFHNDFHSKS